MLFSWWTKRRRDKILQTPFPAALREALAEQVAIPHKLDSQEHQALEQLVQVFIAEKTWVGCGGQEITPYVQVSIAGHACLLLLGRDHDLFRGVETLLVYPSTVILPSRSPGFLEIQNEPVDEGKAVLGVAHQRGPVVLVWDAVQRGIRHPHDGHNVVIHEFAHKIDMLDGAADGTPPLEGRAQIQTWATVCEAAFLALREKVEHHQRTLIDPYGATNEAEFFATATETFFERPQPLLRWIPDLYEVLRDFYRQDPAARMLRETQVET